MKKILLISYYFTPCTLTPSQRITFWAQNMYKLGFYPTVVTREWTSETRSHLDTKRALGTNIRHEVFDTHEIYYLPFKPGILDRAYISFGESALRPLFLFVKLLDVFLVRFTLRFTSFSNFLPFLREHLKGKEFYKAIISGEPFYLYKIGYHLRKDSNLNWIADYRDDWSTNELRMQKKGGGVRKWIANIESNYEKKWVATAQSIISVSEIYTKRISSFVGKKGVTSENGFEEELLDVKTQPLYEKFTVTYSGILYPSQELKVIIGALKLAKDAGSPFYLTFLGAGFDVKERRRIESLVPADLLIYVKVTDRISRNQALIELQKSHILLSIAYGDLKGIPSSKLYEYLALRKPILLCPSDHDVMENMIDDSDLGYVANDPKQCLEAIHKIRDLYHNNHILQLREDALPNILKYSRQNQMEKLNLS